MSPIAQLIHGGDAIKNEKQNSHQPLNILSQIHGSVHACVHVCVLCVYAVQSLFATVQKREKAIGQATTTPPAERINMADDGGNDEFHISFVSRFENRMGVWKISSAMSIVNICVRNI